MRAKTDHRDVWLTNRLISEFLPSRFISRYVFNRQFFYTNSEELNETRRSNVVNALKSTYLKGKVAFRAQLYDLTD